MAKTNWPGVVQIEAKGRAYYYFRRRVGGKYRMIRLPSDPRSPAFAEAYKSLATEDGGLRAAPYSFDALIASYKASAVFTDLSPRTRQDYQKLLGMIGGWVGKKDASRYPRSEIMRMMNSNARRPRTANYLLSMMVILMNHAIDLEWRKDNPAKGIRKLKTGPGYLPWGEDQVEAYRKANAERADAILLFELALGTGQRPGDLVRMKWSDYDGGGISLTQGKTGAALYVPLGERLRTLLDATRPADAPSASILGTEAYTGMEVRFRRARDRAGVKGVSLHGLRKNATIELAEAGCTEAEIKAITGHETSEMVALYSKRANQRKTAQAARRKTEAATREQSESGKTSGKTIPGAD